MSFPWLPDSAHDFRCYRLQEGLRQVERPCVRNNLQCLASRIDNNRAGLAMGEVFFKLLSHFLSDIALKIVADFCNEIRTCYHACTVLAGMAPSAGVP